MTDDAAGSLPTRRLRTTANLVGWAAAGAFVSAAVWFLGGLVPVLGILSLLFISLLISVTTARYRWQLRPKALSGSPSR